MRDILGFFDRARSYGDIFSFKMASPHGILLVHVLDRPEYIRYVLKDNYKNYRKSGAYDRLSSVLGNGLATSEGEFWRRQRRLAQPAFHKRRLERLCETMAGTTERMLSNRWARLAAEGEAIDMAEEMARLTLEIVGRTLLSTDLSAESTNAGRATRYLLRYTDRRVKAPLVLPESVPTPRNRRFREALGTLDALVYGIIARHRSGGEDSGDLISMLASAQDEETGERMSDRQLRDEVMTIIIAGHETTAAALSWGWWLLSKHPEVYRKLRAELDAVLGGRTPSFDDLPSLRYTQAVFQETLRLYPPGWIIARIAKTDDEIAGYAIPERSRVAVSPYLTHRNPNLWDNPEGFDPERFMPENEKPLPEFAYFPFGGGPRQCIGKNFAIMEGTLILAAIAQRYRPDLVAGATVTPEVSMTLRPRGSVPMLLRSL